MSGESTFERPWVRRILPAAVGVLLAAVAILIPSAARADQRDTGGVPQATCFWFGPATMQNPVTNVAYPEESAIYWGARFRLPTGATLLLDGKYPHARFMSLNAYLNAGSTDDLVDTEIKPNRGSVNPYRVGAKRYAKNRAYRVSVPGPGTRTRGLRNVLNSPADGTKIQELIYRVYIPDSAADRAASSLPKPSVRLRNGKVLKGSAACKRINDSQRYFVTNKMGNLIYTGLVNQAREGSGPDPHPTNPAQNPLRWEKYFNLDLALSIFSYGTSGESGRLANKELGEVGAYYDNKAVKYLVGPINQNIDPDGVGSATSSKVLMLQGKLPTTPVTGKSVKTMGSGQMRFWSICQNSSPVETKGVDCVNDAEVRNLIDAERNYTIVVSRAADRPSEATAACGVAWLNWGEEADILGRRSGTLVIRNLGANPTFANSAQKITIDDVDVTKNDADTDNQRGVMGDYLPTGTYFESGTTFDSAFDCAG